MIYFAVVIYSLLQLCAFFNSTKNMTCANVHVSCHFYYYNWLNLAG